ncbi:MAG TPA: hypothetical protein VH352_17670 [Pseudonocardiaceae bacterium]|jgi:hypothetical protein|nr:hypothetical protein [Pseudonocardiaceae bacterium]
MTAMLTGTTVRDSIPRPRPTPASHDPAGGTVRSATRGALTGLATVARFAGHFAVACASVAVVGADTEH